MDFGLGGAMPPVGGAAGGAMPDAAQAEQFWKMLDDLAVSDPESYKQFMKEALDPKNAPDGFLPESETITPEPHFVCKTQNAIGKKIFINFLTHSKIGEPRAIVPETPEEKAEFERMGAEQMHYPLSMAGPFKGMHIHIYPSIC
eukprot:TRINITY_DN131_c0_g1_i1.p1 TRINITY_DN131_c0_g1~~TRINITY_DN131_c0_g1_i1.p1  ORF type:complete len:144 (+),score=32.44 TRINITY_DN131_c0_g1_i1:135-566(+)